MKKLLTLVVVVLLSIVAFTYSIIVLRKNNINGIYAGLVGSCCMILSFFILKIIPTHNPSLETYDVGSQQKYKKIRRLQNCNLLISSSIIIRFYFYANNALNSSTVTVLASSVTAFLIASYSLLSTLCCTIC